MRTLIIDTSSSSEISVGTEIEGKVVLETHKLDRNKAQAVLPMIEDLLKKQKISLQDIDAITVATGPGSFTGLRVGISIANTLSTFLRIPINGEKPGTIILPVYS